MSTRKLPSSKTTKDPHCTILAQMSISSFMSGSPIYQQPFLSCWWTHHSRQFLEKLGLKALHCRGLSKSLLEQSISTNKTTAQPVLGFVFFCFVFRGDINGIKVPLLGQSCKRWLRKSRARLKMEELLLWEITLCPIGSLRKWLSRRSKGWVRLMWSTFEQLRKVQCKIDLLAHWPQTYI